MIVIFILVINRCGKMQPDTHHTDDVHRFIPSGDSVSCKRIFTKPVAAHFNLPHHTIESLWVVIIEKPHNDDALLRKTR